VPATEHAFTEFPPGQLYLDTNFLLAHLVSDYAQHADAVAFLAEVARCGITTLYLSALSWMEFAHIVCSTQFRASLPTDVQQRFRLMDWQQATVRDAFLTTWVGYLEGLLAPFPWYEIAVTDDVRVHALQLMAAFNLDAHDATHVACAQEAGVLDFVSFDRDFRRVDGLHLWTA
jgi:predicted nucleic acid-binding protein